MSKLDAFYRSAGQIGTTAAWPAIERPGTTSEALERHRRARQQRRPPFANRLLRPTDPATVSSPRRTSALVHVVFSAGVALCDICVVIAAAAGAAFLQQALQGGEPTTYSMLSVGSLAATLFVLPGATRGEYAVPSYLKFHGHAKRTALLWNLAFLCILALGSVTGASASVSRGALLIFFCGGFGSLLAARALLVSATQAHMGKRGALARRVFLVGHENEIALFRRRYKLATLGMDIVGAFALRGNATMRADLALATASARFFRPDEVLVIVSWSQRKTIDACIEAFRRVPASIRLGPERVPAQQTHAQNPAASLPPTIEFVRPPLSNVEVLLKRSIDIVGAAVGLALLAPIFAVVAVLIKLDSRGPVIFSQRRYGFNQETFRIFKFRSMTTMEDSQNVAQACRNDPRVTRVGRWLRKCNIDELPQLVNVLRGEMSLVGPRPHAFAHDQVFSQSFASYARRHNMKPGITGWAQVNGYRGQISSEKDIRLRVEHDLHYIDNWSVWLDLQCLWRTFASSKAWRNAY